MEKVASEKRALQTNPLGPPLKHLRMFKLRNVSAVAFAFLIYFAIALIGVVISLRLISIGGIGFTYVLLASVIVPLFLIHPYFIKWSQPLFSSDQVVPLKRAPDDQGQQPNMHYSKCGLYLHTAGIMFVWKVLSEQRGAVHYQWLPFEEVHEFASRYHKFRVIQKSGETITVGIMERYHSHILHLWRDHLIARQPVEKLSQSSISLRPLPTRYFLLVTLFIVLSLVPINVFTILIFDLVVAELNWVLLISAGITFLAYMILLHAKGNIKRIDLKHDLLCLDSTYYNTYKPEQIKDVRCHGPKAILTFYGVHGETVEDEIGPIFPHQAEQMIATITAMQDVYDEATNIAVEVETAYSEDGPTG